MRDRVVKVGRPGEGKVAAGCDVHARGSLHGEVVAATDAVGVAHDAIAQRSLA